MFFRKHREEGKRGGGGGRGALIIVFSSACWTGGRENKEGVEKKEERSKEKGRGDVDGVARSEGWEIKKMEERKRERYHVNAYPLILSLAGGRTTKGKVNQRIVRCKKKRRVEGWGYLRPGRGFSGWGKGRIGWVGGGGKSSIEAFCSLTLRHVCLRSIGERRGKERKKGKGRGLVFQNFLQGIKEVKRKGKKKATSF